MDKKAGYILAVKENQKQLHQAIKDEFKFSKNIVSSTSQEIDHGRIETRVYSVITTYFQFINATDKRQYDLGLLKTNFTGI